MFQGQEIFQDVIAKTSSLLDSPLYIINFAYTEAWMTVGFWTDLG